MLLTCRCVSLFCLQLINQGSPNCLQHPFLPLCSCCWDVSADPSSPPGYHYWPGEELIPCLESLPILLVHGQMSTWDTVLISHPRVFSGPYPLKPVISRPQGVGLSLHHFLSHSLWGLLDHLLYSEYFLWIPILISLPSDSPGGLVKQTVSPPPPCGILTSQYIGSWTLDTSCLKLVPRTPWMSQVWGQCLRHTVPVF